jgi:hypothetical protein
LNAVVWYLDLVDPIESLRVTIADVTRNAKCGGAEKSAAPDEDPPACEYFSLMGRCFIHGIFYNMLFGFPLG